MAHFVVIPVPVRAATCGEPAALSVMVRVPERPPVALGVNVTFTEQVASGASDPPQFVTGTVVAAKSPLAATEEIVNVPEPVLVTIMLRAVDVVDKVCWPKSSEVGLSEMPGEVETPVPLTGIVCGEPVALSTKVSRAERAPAADGVNITLALHCCPGVVSVVQVVERAKSPGFVPPKVTLAKVTVLPEPEVFVTVTNWPGLDVPTVREANVNEAGAMDSVKAAGTVACTSFDFTLSLLVGHAPPPEPDAFVVEAKVKVFDVGCPVERKFPLKAACELPAMVSEVFVEKVQVETQVAVAVVPFPVIPLMTPPTNAAVT
jgi:hypothetical protein